MNNASRRLPDVIGHRFDIQKHTSTVALHDLGIPVFVADDGWGVFHVTDTNGATVRHLLLTVASESAAEQVRELFDQGAKGEYGETFLSQFEGGVK